MPKHLEFCNIVQGRQLRSCIESSASLIWTWLSVRQRIKYKLAMTVYKCLHW